MPNVLIMPAFEHCAPMQLVILTKSYDVLLHRSGEYFRADGRFAAGFHQRKIVNAISQQTPEAMTSGAAACSDRLMRLRWWPTRSRAPRY